MKTYTQLKSFGIVSIVFCFALLLSAINVRSQQAFNPGGTSYIGGTNFSIDTTSLYWTTNGTSEVQVPTAQLVAFTNGNQMLFCAGPAASTSQGSFTNFITGSVSPSYIIEGVDNPGACNMTLNGPGQIALYSSGTEILIGGTGGSTLTLNCLISGTTTLTIDNSGSSTTLLNGTNTYSGGTIIDGTGAIDFKNNSSFGTGTITWAVGGFIQATGSSAINIPNAMTHLANSIETFSGLSSAGVTFSGPWNIGSSGYVEVENILGTITIAGPISGSANLTLTNKANTTAAMTLTGTNTFTGSLTNGNILTIGGTGTLGSSNYAGNILNRTNLIYNSSATQTLSGIISGTGAISNNGTGTLILAATNTYTGATIVNGPSGCTLQLGDGVSLSGTVAGGIAVTNPARLILAPGGAAIAYNGSSQIISGSGAVTMNGPGTFIIGGGHNTYTGGTIINGGILQTGGDASTGGAAANLGTTPSSFQAANITLNGGTLQGNNPNFAFMPNRGITLTANSGLSAIINGNDLIPDQGEMGIQGVITDNNAGYGITITGQTNLTTGLLSGVYLEAVNTYTGPTVVASGILSLFGNGSINNSSSITIASGAVFDVSSNTATTWNLSQPLDANGSGVGLPGFYTTAPTVAALFVGASGGTVNFGSQNLNLTITPTNFNGDGNQPALYVTQGTVSLNGNSVSLTNNGTSPLGYGTYTLIQQAAGSMSVSAAPTLAGGVVAGNGTIANATVSLAVSGGALNLVVAPSAGNPTAPYFSHLTLAPGFTYGSATSIMLSGTLSNLSSGIATAGDTITVQVGTLGAQTATIGAQGNFTITYTLPAYTAAGSYPITYSYSGTLGNATDTSTTLQISQALLSVSASNPSRNYNGNATATVTLTPSPLNGDSVTVSGTPTPFGATNFASPNPGTGITVTISGLILTGPQAANYYLPSTYTLTGNISNPAFTWDGLDSVTNANLQWGDQYNWVGNTAPDFIGDSLDFTGNVGLGPVLQAPYTNWSLLFDSSAGAFVITNSSGSTLSMGAGGITNNSVNTQIIAVPVSTLSSLSSQWYVTNGSSLLMMSNVSDAGGGITLGGAGTLNLSGSNNAITGPLTNLAGTLIFTGGTKLNNESYAGAINNNGTFNFNSSSNQTLSGVISGSGTFILGGTGTLTLSGANTYTGQTIVSNGSLVISKDSNLGTPPATPLSNSIVLNNFINGGANDYGLRDTGGNFTLNANRGIYLGPNGGSINVQNTFTITVAGVISGPGSFYASPNDSAGFGTIILTANNTYQGGTFIGAGVLELGVNGALPTGTPLTVNQSSGTVAATLNMNGFSQTIGPLQSAQFGGAGTFLPTIDLTGALMVLQTNATTTFGGAMTSSGGSLTIATAAGGTPGTLVLTGTNTYTGSTAINAGTLTLGSTGSINDTASVGIGAGGTFDVSAYASAYTLPGGATLKGSGTGTTVGTTAATIKGGSSATLNIDGPVILTFTPTAFTGDLSHPALYISQGALNLAGSGITVTNAAATPLGAGTYTLIQVAGGSISAVSTNITVTGTGLAAGASASLAVSGGSLNLVVTSTTPSSPVINSFVKSGGNLILSGTNGPDNGTYVVLTSTNVALPVHLWTPVSTNSFSPTGAFSVTNSITGNRGFFIIQVP